MTQPAMDLGQVQYMMSAEGGQVTYELQVAEGGHVTYGTPTVMEAGQDVLKFVAGRARWISRALTCKVAVCVLMPLSKAVQKSV